MAIKTLKLRIHPRTFCEEELIVNIDTLTREKFPVKSEDILEISVPPDQDAAEKRASLFLQVQLLPQEVQSKGGPLSISRELAAAFQLEGVREVAVRVVDRAEVGLDLMEVRFKDQALTRSDMWRFTCSLVGRCVYTAKKLEFAGMRAQVCKLWSQGEVVQCGAITNPTRLVFRSASAHVLLFLQISSEMWAFDASGDLYFDKAVNGFLKELFQRWREAGCNHEATLVFFWRVYHDKNAVDPMPEAAASRAIQQGKGGEYYEDFYKVVVERCSGLDWSSKMVDIKKSFLQLKASSGVKDTDFSTASKGNVLEAINLSVNVFEKHHVDTSFLMTGQQVVVVTAGSGVFEVDHELTRLTKERIIDGGIGVDLVCLTQQPLHAVPLFRFFSQDSQDQQEFYHIPHWINYSFYNPPHAWNQFRFQPKLQISDHLINVHLKTGAHRNKGTMLSNPFTTTKPVQDRLLHRVDPDEYDGSIFLADTAVPSTKSLSKSSQGKVQSVARMTASGSDGRVQGVAGTSGEGEGRGSQPLLRHSSQEEEEEAPAGSPATKVVFEIRGTSPDELNDAFEPRDQYGSPRNQHPPVRINREAAFTKSMNVTRSRIRSENLSEAGTSFEPSSFTTPGSLAMASSVESLKQSYLGKLGGSASAQNVVTRKKRAIVNPFDPKQSYSSLTAHQRRWMHTFPRNKSGIAFQVHHAILENSMEASGSLTLSQRSTGSLAFSDQDVRTALPSQRSTSAHPAKSKASDGAGYSVSPSAVASTSPQSPSSRTVGTGSKFPPARVGTPKSTPTFQARASLQATTTLSTSKSEPVRSPATLSSLRVLRKKKLFSAVNVKQSMQVQPKYVEEFASVRRLGIDWRSLTEPACLPITTDFFPSDDRLSSEYFEYPTKLVVTSYDGFGDSSDEKVLVPWRSDHQNMSTFQAFREMLSQRLIQGFQLVFGEGSGGHCDTVFSLHSSLWGLQSVVAQLAASSKNRQNTQLSEIVAKLSLGRVFQKIELKYPDLEISIYRPKTPHQAKSTSYCYQLCSGGEVKFEPSQAEFRHTRVEEYNWNYLDQHVCGYSDFEVLGESQKYNRCRYLLLPAELPRLGLFAGSPEQARCQEEGLVAGFVHFLDILNHISRGQPSSQGMLPQLKRHQSLPATYFYTGSRSSTPHETHSNIASPKARKLSGIGEEERSPSPPSSLHDSRPIRTPDFRALKSSHHSFMDGRDVRTRNTVDKPLSDLGDKLGRTERVSLDSALKPRKDRHHASQELVGSPMRRAKSRDELTGSPHHEGSGGSRPSSPSTRRLKTSPRLLRRKSREELAPLETPKSGRSSVPVHVTPATPTLTEGSEISTQDTLSGMESPVSSSPLASLDSPLTSNTPLPDILKAMESPYDGIDFLVQQTGLRPGAFVAMEAVRWLVETVEGVASRQDATRLLQEMLKENLIAHASGDPAIPFLDGYFFYYMPHRELQKEIGKEAMERSFLIIDSMNFELFSKRWFEVAVTSQWYESSSPSLPLSLTSPATSFQQSHSPFYYMDFQNRQGNDNLLSTMMSRYVELNPDPQMRSDRPEWCFARYDHTYHPHSAFQFELQWMVATVALLHQLIQSWVHKATMCGFNLVAVPMLSSIQPDQQGCHPFRRHVFIPLKLPLSFPTGPVLQSEAGTTAVGDNLAALFSAITNKLGFLLDPASLPSQDLVSPILTPSQDPFTSRVYVHHTGSALIQPVYEDDNTRLAASRRSSLQYSFAQAKRKSQVHQSFKIPTSDDNNYFALHKLPEPPVLPQCTPSPPLLGTSTPLEGLSPLKQRPQSPTQSLRVPPPSSQDSSFKQESGVCESRGNIRSGFYWYRNFLLLKQKNVASSVLEKHNTILGDFTALCNDDSGQLSELCDLLFTRMRKHSQPSCT